MHPTNRGWVAVAASMLAAGWGANQFAPMVQLYRSERGLSEQMATGLFAAYVVGLMPALLGAAWLSQHHGKRPLVRASVVLMLLGTALLVVAGDSIPLLLLARVTTGVGVGCVVGPGAAWVKELSEGTPPGTGARRASVGLIGGFALGALVAGTAAHLLPHPFVVPYALHLGLQAVVGLAVWRVAELDHSDHPTPRARSVVDHVTQGWFVRTVLPSAPWVFGTTAVSFVVIPSLAGRIPGVPVVLAAGLTAGATLGTSVVLQPFVRRHAVAAARRVIALGMLVCAAGMGIATAAAVWPSPLWLPLSSLVLGTANGILVVGVMTLVELRTPHHLLAPMTAVVYCLTYIGFLAPWFVSIVSLAIPVPLTLGLGALEALLTSAWCAHTARTDD